MIDSYQFEEWMHEHLTAETEGSRTPAQAHIQIRADFARRGFCLFAGGEPVGAVRSYKKTWLEREAALAQVLA